MNPPYIPATALGGDLVRDWTGPTDEWVPPGATSFSGRWAPSVVLDGHPYPDRYRVQVRLRLDPRREEVATRIATVLRVKGHEVGHLLPVSLGGRQGDGVEHCRHEWRENGYATRYCERCHKTMASTGFQCRGCGGLPEKFVPCHGSVCAACAAKGVTEDHFPGVHMPVVPVVRRTIPAADVSAVLLAASVAGVEAGRGVVRGVLGEWERHRDGFCFDRRLLFPTVKRQSVHYARYYDAGSRFGGWSVHMPSFGDPIDQGEENGPEGRAAVDAALLRFWFAYLDPAAPFGVVVPFPSAEGR